MSGSFNPNDLKTDLKLPSSKKSSNSKQPFTPKLIQNIEPIQELQTEVIQPKPKKAKPIMKLTRMSEDLSYDLASYCSFNSISENKLIVQLLEDFLSKQTFERLPKANKLT